MLYCVCVTLDRAKKGEIMATLHTSDGNQKTVDNLGWLLAHAGQVKQIEYICEFGKEGGILTADCGSAGIYHAEFTSSMIARNFLNRRLFRGVTLNWSGVATTCTANHALLHPAYSRLSKSQRDYYNDVAGNCKTQA